MSLQFVIDGYNIIHHAKFTAHTTHKIKDPRADLLEFIKTKRLCGSLRNKAIVVFDGYPPMPFERNKGDIEVVFSRGQSADEKIKKIVESNPRRKDIVVVSDDKEIIYAVKLSGARALTVAEFITEKEFKAQGQSQVIKPELSFTEMDKINKELKEIWLK